MRWRKKREKIENRKWVNEKDEMKGKIPKWRRNELEIEKARNKMKTFRKAYEMKKREKE